jgi:hypothetical protein
MLLLYIPLNKEIRSGIPKGIRTPVTAVKGRCPRPLDDRDTELAKCYFRTYLIFYKSK